MEKLHAAEHEAHFQVKMLKDCLRTVLDVGTRKDCTTLWPEATLQGKRSKHSVLGQLLKIGYGKMARRSGAKREAHLIPSQNAKNMEVWDLFWKVRCRQPWEIDRWMDGWMDR